MQTAAERMKKSREKRKKEGYKELRHYVPVEHIKKEKERLERLYPTKRGEEI